MSLRARDFPDRGVLVWFALTAGIAAWVLHLVAFAALVEFVHDYGYSWLFTLGNCIAVLVTLVAGWLSWLIYQAGDDDEELGTPGGRMRFLGALGIVVNGINLLLIVARRVLRLPHLAGPWLTPSSRSCSAALRWRTRRASGGCGRTRAQPDSSAPRPRCRSRPGCRCCWWRSCHHSTTQRGA